MNNAYLKKCITLLLTLIITFAVAYWSLLRTYYILEVSLEPKYAVSYIKIDDNTITPFYKKKDTLTFTVSGKTQDETISQLSLFIWPPNSLDSAKHQIVASSNSFSTQIILASEKKSIDSHGNYIYKLYSDYNRLLSWGLIKVQIKDTISGGDPWYMILTSAVGFISSMLQILGLFETKKK